MQEPSPADPPCAGLRVWAGRAARTPWLQGEPREAAINITSDYATWVALLYLKVQMEVPM